MHPILFTVRAFQLFKWTVGPITLPTYGFLLAVAFLVSLWVAGRQAARSGLDAAKVSDLAIYVLIAGLVGAKAMLVIVDWRYFSQHVSELFSILRSGGVFYGGLLAALPVAWFYSRRHALDGWRTADALAPAVVIGQAIGRLGCLAAGCCHGMPAHVPWAITFHDPYTAQTIGTPLEQPLHPTQVYESVACLLIFAFLLWLAPRKRFHGQVVLSYVVLYSVARFVIEFYRGDVVRGFVHITPSLAFSTSQFIACLMVLGALAVLPYARKKQPIEPAAA